MIEVKFVALKPNGQTISGSLTEPNYGDAKKKIQNLAVKNQLKIQSIQKKVWFLYKVKRGREKPLTGEQRAYTKEEVVSALRRLGYEVLSVHRKYLEFNFKPPIQ
jgi:type IV pilus assembly protein PilC